MLMRGRRRAKATHTYTLGASPQAQQEEAHRVDGSTSWGKVATNRYRHSWCRKHTCTKKSNNENGAGRPERSHLILSLLFVVLRHKLTPKVTRVLRESTRVHTQAPWLIKTMTMTPDVIMNVCVNEGCMLIDDDESVSLPKTRGCRLRVVQPTRGQFKFDSVQKYRNTVFYW